MTGRLLQMSGVVVDLIYDVEEVPRAGDEAIVTGFAIAPGGGFNAMVAARRGGMSVCYGGAIGTGPFAQIVADGLNAEAIACLRRPDPGRDQGCCTVMIDRAGERTFVASDGAEGHITETDLARIDFAAFDWTLLSGYALHYAGSRDTLAAWLRGGAADARLVFDPSPIAARLDRAALGSALERAEWVSANRQEAADLTGETDAAAAAQALARGRSGGAVVRDGAAGCLVATAEGCTRIAGFRVDAIDTNGAGDTHVGSFIAALHHGGDPLEAARQANAAAALSTTKKGPATAPMPEAVARFLQDRQANLTAAG